MKLSPLLLTSIFLVASANAETSPQAGTFILQLTDNGLPEGCELDSKRRQLNFVEHIKGELHAASGRVAVRCDQAVPGYRISTDLHKMASIPSAENAHASLHVHLSEKPIDCKTPQPVYGASRIYLGKEAIVREKNSHVSAWHYCMQYNDAGVNDVSLLGAISLDLSALDEAPYVYNDKRWLDLFRLTVDFEHDKHKIRADHVEHLKSVVSAMAANPEAILALHGHASLVGDHGYNQDLSLMRALAVKRYLIDELNAAPSQLKIIGWGELHPADLNKTSQTEQNNRRVEGMLRLRVKNKKHP